MKEYDTTVPYSRYSIGENRLIYRGFAGGRGAGAAAAGRASVASAHGGSSSSSPSSPARSSSSSAPTTTAAQRAAARIGGLAASGASLTAAGKAALASAQSKAANQTPSGAFLTYQAARASLSPADQAVYDAALASNVNGPIDAQEAFINQLAQLKDQKDLADLSKVKSDEQYFLDKAVGTQDQNTGEELRKNWLQVFSDKGGGGEFGEGTGTYRSFADEAQGERNRIVGQATTESQSRITKAQSDYDYNRSVGDLNQQHDIAGQEQDRTAQRAQLMTEIIGLSANRNNQTQQSTIFQPNIPTTGRSSFYADPSGYVSPYSS